MAVLCRWPNRVACMIAVLAATAAGGGCRNFQYARVMHPGEPAMVGSHQAGAETFRPLVDEVVARLLAKQAGELPVATYPGQVLTPEPKRICFVGIENKSAEEIGDFKEQLYECIDTGIQRGEGFSPISRRFVDVGLRETRLRPDELMVPEKMRMFVGYMEQQGQPFDYLLFASLTSGTTRENKDYQRDYLLTLELVDIQTGQYDKESASISKGYHHSRLGRWWSGHGWK